MSVSAARIKSPEEASGICTLVGNHEIVSDTRSERVANNQTR
jgi:hypothetical protein